MLRITIPTKYGQEILDHHIANGGIPSHIGTSPITVCGDLTCRMLYGAVYVVSSSLSSPEDFAQRLPLRYRSYVMEFARRPYGHRTYIRKNSLIQYQ